MHMAVDRAAIAESIMGNGATPLDAICYPKQFGCDHTVKPPAYDPVAAKKLLADAGYPNGFEMEINTVGRSRQIAEAVSGYLRKIGVRTKIRTLTFPSYRKLQRQGKLMSLIHTWSNAGIPDVGSSMSFFFSPGARNYHGDKRLLELRKVSESVLDPASRKAFLREAMDIVNKQSYNTVVTSFPAVFVHSKDVAIEKGSIAGFGLTLPRLSWK